MNFMDNDEQSGSLYSRMVRKNLDEVTLEDVANLDLLSICCDEPVRQTTDHSRLNTILDITPFKPFKPLTRREERAAKAKEAPPKPAPNRRLPFSGRKAGITFKKGEAQTLKTHTMNELEQDYFKSLLDSNGRFQKYVPKMACQGDALVIEFRLQVAEGKIWRTFHMDASTNFYLLRRAILDLLSWKDDVSWSFMYVNRNNQTCMIGQTGVMKTDEEIRNEEQLVIIEALNENYCKFCFLYDLQVRWRVEIMLTRVLDKSPGVVLPVCVRGKGLLSFSSISSPDKLDKVCTSLKNPNDPKRAKYISKYGDLLAQAPPVSSTPFPSFYSGLRATPVPPAPRKRRKVEAEGPIMVTIEIDSDPTATPH